MKMYKKKNLKYKNGYIMDGDKVVPIDNDVVCMANELETMVQKAKHEAEQPKTKPAKPFVRKSEIKRPTVRVSTPCLDIKVAETMAIMDELDDIADVEKINECLATIDKLVQFAKGKSFLSSKQPTQVRFDLPTLGNPLKLSVEDIVEYVTLVYHGE